MTWDRMPAEATRPVASRRCPTCGHYTPLLEPRCVCGDGRATHAIGTKAKPCSRSTCGCTHYRPAASEQQDT